MKFKQINLKTFNTRKPLCFLDDGDVDVVVCNNVGAPEIYENLGGNEVNFWLKVNVMHR